MVPSSIAWPGQWHKRLPVSTNEMKSDLSLLPQFAMVAPSHRRMSAILPSRGGRSSKPLTCNHSNLHFIFPAFVFSRPPMLPYDLTPPTGAPTVRNMASQPANALVTKIERLSQMERFLVLQRQNLRQALSSLHASTASNADADLDSRTRETTSKRHSAQEALVKLFISFYWPTFGAYQYCSVYHV